MGGQREGPVGRGLRWAGTVWRTARALREFLADGFGPEPVETFIRRRVATRRERFLSFLQSYIFDQPRSPYLQLLKAAGCEYGDVAALVGKGGIEGALGDLYDAGVYVTHDEMKGCEPIRRGSKTFAFKPADFANPVFGGHVHGHSSGSTGRATNVPVNFAHFKERSYQHRAFVWALRMLDGRLALWLPPTYSMVAHTLKFSHAGWLPRRWLCQVAPADIRTSAGYRLQVFGLIGLSRLLGTRWPLPRHVPLSHPGPVVEWAVSVASSGRPAIIDTYPSSAVRAALWAHRRGISLDNVGFTVAGESLTAARRKAIERTGARLLNIYGTVEQGLMAGGCQRPEGADDMHIFTDIFAVISRERRLPDGNAVDALVVTDFSRTGPQTALNLETGDCGVLERRACGCPWKEAGYALHLRDVWSYAKLTTEGLTFDGAEVFDIIERALPARFGGCTGDYQLIARPDVGGTTRYLLAVSPSVGDVDAAAVREEFLRAISGSGSTAHFIAEFLHRAHQLRVVRRPPVVLPSGKSLPVLLRH
jgi:hypothetical protein